MKYIDLDNARVEISEDVQSMSKDFLDFSLKHIADDYDFWHHGKNWHYVKLIGMHIISKLLHDGLHAMMLKFAFAEPLTHLVNGSIMLKDAVKYCFEHEYYVCSNCYVELVKAKTLYELIVKLNLDHGFPVELNNMIEHSNKLIQ